MRALTSWAILSAVALGGLGFLLFGRSSGRQIFLPGHTSDGHYQIEGACEACHGEPFAAADTLQQACERCHARELEAARDSHPRSKFTDPRNAERVKKLDARRCVTCHREHWPEATSAMGLTLPVDYCHQCHSDVARERPSHARLDFASCASTGCHRFHDNRGTYADYLVGHASEPELLAGAAAHRTAPPSSAALGAPLGATDRDSARELSEAELAAWAASAHARARVNCNNCHAPRGAWSDAVALATCASCHDDQRAGWVSGRHGMRVGLGLPAMRPGAARAPMRAEAAAERLSCSSCHAAHGFDRWAAAVTSCQRCHADAHTLAYAASPHARTWAAELSGAVPAGSGVSCATCHLPRVHRQDGGDFVQHNPNDNLRPADKMLRSVCEGCHGLAFSIDALADPALVAGNFNGRPRQHVPSIDWALARGDRAARRVNP